MVKKAFILASIGITSSIAFAFFVANYAAELFDLSLHDLD